MRCVLDEDYFFPFFPFFLAAFFFLGMAPHLPPSKNRCAHPVAVAAASSGCAKAAARAAVDRLVVRYADGAGAAVTPCRRVSG
jgi:hypothetical protein